MTTSFADFVATQDARNDIQLKIREYCLMLCEALEQDFVQECIKRAHFFGADNAEYREKRLADIKAGKDMYKFYICLLYTSPSPRDVEESRMPSSA